MGRPGPTTPTSFAFYMRIIQKTTPENVLNAQVARFLSLPTNAEKARYVRTLPHFSPQQEPIFWRDGRKDDVHARELLAKADTCLRALPPLSEAVRPSAVANRCNEGIRLVNEAICHAPGDYYELMAGCMLCRAEFFCKCRRFELAEKDLEAVKAAMFAPSERPEVELTDTVFVSLFSSESTANRFITVASTIKYAKGDYCGAGNNLLYAGKLARATRQSADPYYIEEWRKLVEEIRAVAESRGVALADLLADQENSRIPTSSGHLVESGDHVPDVPGSLKEDPLCLKLYDIAKESTNFLEGKELFGGEHKTMKGCCAALDMVYTEEKGRHMVANQHIPAGSVLVMEKPYAVVFAKEKTSEYCFNCKNRLNAVVFSCPACSLARYCSQECKESEEAKLHRTECSHSGNLMNEEDITPVGHLAYNVILRTGWEKLRALKPELEALETNPTKDFFNDEGPGGCNAYLNIFSQVTNEGRWKKELLFQAANVAVYLTMLLAKTCFFKSSTNPSGRPSEEEFSFVAGLMYHHMMTLKCNRYALVETTYTPGHCDGAFIAFAKAVSTVLTLFNHSCTYGACWDYIGDKVVVHNLVPFEKGDEVTINFGYNYAVNDKERRQQRLRDLYAFDCDCVACVENWPEVSPVNDIAEQALFLCPKCRYKMGSSTCRRCGTNITKLVLQMGTHQQNFDTAKALVSQGPHDIYKAKSLMQDYINFLKPSVSEKAIDLVLAINLFRRCFALQGRVVYKPRSMDDEEAEDEDYHCFSLTTG